MDTLDQCFPIPTINWDAKDQQITFKESGSWHNSLNIKGIERKSYHQTSRRRSHEGKCFGSLRPTEKTVQWYGTLSPLVFSGITSKEFISCWINRKWDMEQVDINITRNQAKCQFEPAMLKWMKRDLLFNSCKYFEVHKCKLESKVYIEYEKVLHEAKVH